eukprot:1816037-Amphidinium_carterae.1
MSCVRSSWFRAAYAEQRSLESDVPNQALFLYTSFVLFRGFVIRKGRVATLCGAAYVWRFATNIETGLYFKESGRTGVNKVICGVWRFMLPPRRSECKVMNVGKSVHSFSVSTVAIRA